MQASHKRVSEISPMHALVRRARRRRLFQLLVDEGALAAAIVFGGGIVLLVLGSEILSWYWLAGLVVGGIVFGCYRLLKRIESRYQIACTLDSNLVLHDALSTALYFSDHPSETKSQVIELQRDMAEQAARSADLRRGLPFVMSRSVYISGLLALIVGGLFALRYGVTGTMDLNRSLIRIAHDSFVDPTKHADARKKPGDPRAKDWANPAGLTYDPWEAQPIDQTGNPETSLAVIDTPDVDNSDKTNPSADPRAKGNPSKDNPDSAADDPNSDRSSGGNDQSPDGSQAPSKDSNNSKSGTPPQGSDQKGQNSNENSSLSDKMKDALSDLLSKFKSPPRNGSGKQNGSQQNQPGTQQQNAANRMNNPNGSPTPGRPQDDANASPDGQEGKDSQGNQQAKSGQGKSGKGDDTTNSQDGKSGIGRQDGDKNVHEAEQLAAMGKISEIIGKRAQNVSGEVMVEVSSGNQQLKTQYSQKKATHADTGGEIGRDEVPLAYQQFVQQYFEEIRKTPAASTPKTKKSPDAPKKGAGS